MNKPTVFTSPEGEFTISAPNGLCPACVEKSTQKHNKLAIAVCYCPHHAAGGLLYLNANPPVWRIIQPVTREAFLEPILAESLELAHAMKQTH